MKDKVLFLFRGIPGSGKSTACKLLVGEPIEADQYHINSNGDYVWLPGNVAAAHKWCQNQVELRMKDGNPRIGVANTFTTQRELEPYLELAKQYGYSVVSMVVENRHGGENIHDVPHDTLEAMRRRFQVKL